MDISERLKTLRESKGYSQEDLAKKLNISRQSISKWELGKSIPDINYFIKLSEIYNLTLDELIKNDIGIENNEKEVKVEDTILKKGIDFYKKDFIYRHTNRELVKIILL